MILSLSLISIMKTKDSVRVEQLLLMMAGIQMKLGI